MMPRPSKRPSIRITRRELLGRLAGQTCLGLSLPTLLAGRAVAAAGSPAVRAKACIMIFYYGGPSHLDTFDLKPDAPAEVRGEFRPISTSVPGVHICEHLPRLANVMHKVCLIRSMHHQMRLHDAACVHTLTGRPPVRGDGENFSPPDEATLYPSLGAAYSYVVHKQGLAVPNAALPYVIRNVVPVPCQTGGMLGPAYNPLVIAGDPQRYSYRAEQLQLPEGLTAQRVRQRMGLLAAARLAGNPRSERELRWQEFYAKALDLLATEQVQRALRIEEEPQAVRDRYGWGDPAPAADADPNAMNGAHLAEGLRLRGQNLLLARRLVEAGVPFVNVYDYRQQGQNWDAHSQNFKQHRDYLLPPCDQALAALISDLDERGLLDTTLVVALGEFGRTPRINKDAGRDHWPDCYSVLLAGGGVHGGYVHGASDALGAYPARDPVSPEDLAATIFTLLGIDPATELHDLAGRPFKLADGTAVTEVFS
ncbi:MAG: DUF1501 domain-containing protein [Pirellulales bacterium]|nr:DUF1501 domain-containing protein [Pirellulales bacterium]